MAGLKGSAGAIWTVDEDAEGGAGVVVVLAGVLVLLGVRRSSVRDARVRSTTPAAVVGSRSGPRQELAINSCTSRAASRRAL